MSELIVIGYDDADTATRAYLAVLALEQDNAVDLDGLAIVQVGEDGKTRVETPQRVVGATAASGALWGILLGLLFFVPFLGFALGGALGVLMVKAGQSGIDERFRGQVHDLVAPGRCAVVLMASKVAEDTFAAGLAPHRGTVLQTSLSEADERELAHDLSVDAH